MINYLLRPIKNKLKGWYGEQKTDFNLWFWLDQSVYRKFSDLILPSKNGTTQIDHILVSPYGVFIIETKNRKGWVFGSEHQSKWTHVFFKEKHTFQNPLKQTFRQKKVLSEFLKLDESLIHTIVFFNGGTKFKTPLPSNVLSSGLSSYIKEFEKEIISDSEIRVICNSLIENQFNNPISKKEHLQSVNKRYSSNNICPKCGSKLVIRRIKRGPRTGTEFLGCEGYPNCKFTKNN